MDILDKLLTILTETSDQLNLSAERIADAVVQLFQWVVARGEVHIHRAGDLKVDIAGVIENRACEHGSRYRSLVNYDAFWDEKRLRTLKDARRATRHHHVAVEGIAPLLDRVKTGAKKEIKEWKE